MPLHHRPPVLLCLLVALAFPFGAVAQVVRLGSELHVNSHTPENQYRQAVAASDSGDFVVAWESDGQDGDNQGVFARRFSSAGVAQATELQVNTYTTSRQRSPSVATSDSGDFVVVWESLGQDGSAYGVFTRRFSSAGAAQASELQVNSFTPNNQGYPSVAARGSGDFVVAWESSGQDGSSFGIFARRFSSTGVAQASEFQVNTYTTSFQRFPSVAVSGSGDFVVAWDSYGQDGPGYGYGVFARRFSSAGVAQAIELQVNTYTMGHQLRPSVAASGSGDFVVAWQSRDQDGSSYGVFAQRFSSAGEAQAAEFQVNTYTTDYQFLPSVAAWGSGDFVVAWGSIGQDGSGSGIFARRFSSTGTAQASELQVNTYTTDSQSIPAAAASGSGDFVVAWGSRGQDGSVYGVFAQRFVPPATLDIDANGSVGALTDGLLVLRYLFGFTGTTLTNGAVGTGSCGRCDHTAIEPYLGALGLTLDVDANGSVGALTDGLLVLRYLFGFTGTTLTAGTVDTVGCTRCEAATIEPYLAGLV